MSELRLRAATLDDARRLWDWRNDGDVRAHSFSQAPIEWPDHLVWLERKLEDVCCRLWVVELGGAPAGQIRYDADGDQAEVSLSMAAPFRGQGLAVAALRASAETACRELHVKDLVAFVKEENIASCRAFERAGYRLVGRCLRRGLPCRRYEWSRSGEAAGAQP